MSAIPQQQAWTDRQRREAAFYRDYAPRQRVEAVDLAPVLGQEQRPWNPYWAVYALARQRFLQGDRRLLDFGCGAGAAAIRLAHVGYRVDGFDLSEDNLAIARDLATTHRVADQCTFRAMLAEQLDYADNTFDVIVGIDILHHVDIPRAVAEAYRVLKPGGIAIFKEHIEASVFDRARNSRLGLMIAPKACSQDLHITEDERKLTAADLRTIADSFDRVETRRFTLLGRLDRLLASDPAARARLQQVDHRLLQLCPALARLAGTAVLICHRR